MLTTGAVTGAGTGSAGLIGLIVFFMINSSVSPTNLWPMLGSLLTMLSVNDVDGKLFRGVCEVRNGASNGPNDEFNDDVDDDDIDRPPAASDANADGLARLLSIFSLLYRDVENELTENA